MLERLGNQAIQNGITAIGSIQFRGQDTQIGHWMRLDLIVNTLVVDIIFVSLVILSQACRSQQQEKEIMEESAFSGTVQLERTVFATGDRIFAQGESGDCAYVLLRGKVGLYHHNEGHRTEVGDISPGEIFGEMAVLDGGNRSASAVALEEAEVALVPYAIFRRKLDSADRFLKALIELFIRNIRNSSRLFLRRPRSFRDHVKQMRVFSWNMRRFAGRMDDASMADDLLDVLDRLDTVLTDLQNVSDLCPDQRHDLITEEELSGVGFGDVVSSEGQRKL